MNGSLNATTLVRKRTGPGRRRCPTEEVADTASVGSMTAIAGPRRSTPTLPVMALAVGAVSIAAWLVPGVVGMVIVGLTGTVAILLGAGSLLAVDDKSSRSVRVMGTVAVVLGLVGLAGLWVTAVLVAAIPG